MRGLTAPRVRNDSPAPLVSRAAGRFTNLFGRRTDAVAQMSAMGSVGILFSIVNRTSNATAAVDWHLYRKAKSGKKEDRVEVTSHAAIDLWNKPNPFMPRQEFVETSQQHVDLTGESYWVVARDKRFKNLPLELWPVRPDRMIPVPHPEKFLAGWIYVSPDGEEVPLDLDQVIQLRMPNPLDLYRGMGPVQALLTDLDAVRYSAEWNRNFFLNSAEPGGIIEVEKRLSDDEFDEMSMRWEEQHRGVSRAHRVAILEQGKWIDRKYTMRDMQFAELRAVGRDTIIEAFGMHKIAIGISDDVNRASATAGKALFAEDLTVPRLERHKGALNNDFLPLFGDTARDLEWDYDSPVPADAEADNAERTSKASAAKTYIDAGFTGESVVDALELPDALVWEKPAPPPAPAVGPGPAGPTPAEPGAPQPTAPPPAPANSAADLLAAFRQRHIDTVASDPLHNAELPAPVDGWPESDEDAVNAVDLGPVQVAWEAALAALLTTWQASVVADWIRQLVDAVKGVLGGDDRTGLAALEVDVTDAVTTLTDAMAGLAETAAGHVVDEAAASGVDLDPHWPTAGDLEAAAQRVAEFEARRYSLTAGREAARVAGPEPDVDFVGDHLDTFLNELSDTGAKYALGGALTDTQNLARAETFAAGPVGALYASEVLDHATCLAPGTLVTARRGNIRADEVTLDDELLTHAGRWVAPSQIVISDTAEDLVVAELGNGRQLRVTDDHPVLVVENDVLVWRKAGQLTVGALMVGEESLEGGGELIVPDLVLGEAPHGVPPGGQVGGLATVDVRPERVPVAAVRLDHEPVADEEVHNPRSDLDLRGEVQALDLQELPDSPFDAGLQPAGQVAARRTVATVLRAGRDGAEVVAARLAGDVDRRTSAGLGAVGAHDGLAVTEGGTAPSAGGVSSARGARANAGAVVVPARVGDGNLEGDRAVRTDLLDAVTRRADLGANLRVRELAGDRTVDGASLAATGDHATAGLAEARRELASPARAGGVGSAAFAASNGDTAVLTRSVHKLTVVRVLSVRREAHVGQVYDFTIPGDETFWAEGVLVHNCKPCREVHGRWICNTDELGALYRLYPFGGYVDCLGRERCRGTVVGVWRPATTEGGK